MVTQRNRKGDDLGMRRLQAAFTERLRDGGPNYAVGRWQDPRLVDEIGQPYVALPNPFISRRCHNDLPVIEEDFCVNVGIQMQARHWSDCQVDVALSQLALC